MRDAHEIARHIVSESIIDPDDNPDHICQSSFCDCAKLTNNKKLKRRGFKIKEKHKKEAKRANINELHSPYKPCRRTCSCSHNPIFHADRMQKEHLQRLHGSATKLMIMSVIPERPKSADSADRKRQEYYNEIDYTGSSMYVEVLKRKFKKMLRTTATSMGANLDELIKQAKEENNTGIETLIRNNSALKGDQLNKIIKKVQEDNN
jgi:hypothetical protein